MPHCTECDLLLPSVQALQIHNLILHEISDSSTFRCKEPECTRDFTTWKTFKKHLRFTHNCPLHTETKCQDFNKCSSEEFDMETIDFDESLPDTSADQENNHMSQREDMHQKLYDVVLSFCGKLYSTPDLPRSNVQQVVEDTIELVGEMVKVVKSTICAISKNRDEYTAVTTEVEGAVDTMTAPFESLATEYRRLTAFKQKGGFISPTRYIVGETVDDKLVDGKITKETIASFAQFIPLRQTLFHFFSLPGVLDSVLDYMSLLSTQSGILSNFVQGELWQEKVKQHFNGKIVIPLFFYYDDFEVNNPLGSHAGIQKLGGLYCTLPCLPPEFRSSLENIFLVSLFHADDRKAFGNNSIFRIVVDEINYLQEHGITFKSGGIDKRIFFALGLVTGDNLGINSAFDLVESFRGAHFCRFCLLSGKDTAKCIRENEDQLRSVDEYEHDLEQGVSCSGVKRRSVWNSVHFFHIYENLYVDPLHDLSEGVFKYGMGHIIYHYVFDAQEKLSLEVLNDRMRTFNYTASNITNKPPLFRYNDVKDRKLSMTGSEMVNLVYIFPFLIGDYVEQNEVWQFYLTLRNIYDIVAAKDIQKDCYILLEDYVTEHHRLYLKLFRDNLKATHHNMIHYARIMRKSGPILALTTIRSESKNREFKQSAKSTYSRRNITHTLALKESFRMFYRQLCGRGFVSKLKFGPASIPDRAWYEDVGKAVPAGFRDTCIEVPWVEVKGILYRNNTCVILTLDSDELPVFGVITMIFSNENEKVLIQCDVCENMGFDEKFHAYDIKTTNNLEFWELDKLFTPFPCIMHRMGNGHLFATIKTAI